MSGRKQLMVVLVAVLGVVGAPSLASASGAPLPPDQAAGLPANSAVGGLTARSLDAPGQLDVLIGGVSACYGQTDQPHKSSHVAGTVNVVARTVCPATDYVGVNLYRSRWYGWEHRGSGSKTAFGTATANAAAGCSAGTTYTYLGSSYHEATGVGYAYTSNSRRFTC